MTTGQLITAPAAAEPVGLAAAVGTALVLNGQDELGTPGDWRKGYTLIGDVCGATSRYILNPMPCDDEGNQLVSVPDTDDFMGWEAGVPGHPFVVGAGVKCSTFSSSNDLADWKNRAQRRLEVCQWSDVADELWNGTTSKLDGLGNRYFKSPEAEILTGTSGTPVAVGVVDAIATMDSGFASCGCGGPRVIHVPVFLLAHLKNKAVIERRGNQYFTPAGNQVVFDDGYDGTGPDTGTVESPVERAAPAENTAWIYGTTQIVAKLDDIRFPGGDDWANYAEYRTNDVVMRAERYAMASWLCCHLAVLVTTV